MQSNAPTQKKKERVYPITPGFVKYMLTQENAPLLAKLDDPEYIKEFAQHESAEGGNKTFGFGHKLTDTERDSQYVNGIHMSDYTAEDLMTLFKKDTRQVWKNLDAKLSKMDAPLSSLSQRQREALFDHEFNVIGGIDTFPKMTAAVLSNTWDVAASESSRKYTNKETKEEFPLVERNKGWLARFSGEHADFAYGSDEAEVAAEEAVKPRELRLKEHEAKVAAEKEAVRAQQEASQAQQPQQQAPQALADAVPQGHLRGMLAPDTTMPGMLDPNFKYYGK